MADEPNELITWRGTIDSLPPRLLNFTTTKGTGGVTYALTVEDFDLAVNALEMPAACASATTTLTKQRYESPWYLALAEQVSNASQAAQVRTRMYQLSLICQTTVAITTDRFRICDIVGNCTDINLGPQSRKIYLPLIKKM